MKKVERKYFKAILRLDEAGFSFMKSIGFFDYF